MKVKKFPVMGIKIFLTDNVLGFKHIKPTDEVNPSDLEKESMELEELMQRYLIVVCLAPDIFSTFSYGFIYFDKSYEALSRNEAKNRLNGLTFNKKIDNILSHD
jgi:hypothetical protein